MIGHKKLRLDYINFFKERGHVEIEPASLVLENDPTTLFTSSGMQPLVPYLLGKKHEKGTRLVDIQPSIRVVDIDDVGDNRHTTMFEMLGNWGLGSYFKKEQLTWCFEFITKMLEIPKEKLHVTVFKGDDAVERDLESVTVWQSLGVEDDHIHFYDVDKNWWSRSGTPDQMPKGEIGGPDSEIFFEFESVKHDASFGELCHPNCDCGRFMEICNSVFIQYKKGDDGALEELPQKNVDFGGGLERLLAAANNNPDVFQTDVFTSIIKEIESVTQKKYSDVTARTHMRIIADHIKASVFLIANDVSPSNKEQGYVLRRLLRRAAVSMYSMTGSTKASFTSICEAVLGVYDAIGKYPISSLSKLLQDVIGEEMVKFSSSLDRGVKYLTKLSNDQISDEAFNLFQNYGFPFEITKDLALERGVKIERSSFDRMYASHKKLSQQVKTGIFKGGLADHSQQVVKYHTATHLIHKALREILGDDVRQEGSNITGERLRFDFLSSSKPTKEQILEIERIVNNKIKEELPVYQLTIPKSEAEQIGAMSFFKEKYPDMVSVYCIGGDMTNPKDAYSKEFCGGPHVANTSEIGTIKIDSIKKIGANILRLYAS